jgi:hypothetical protein
MDPSPSHGTPLPDRLTALAQQAREAGPQIPQSNAALLDHCLSTLESLLDPTTTTTTTDEANCCRCRCHQEPPSPSTAAKHPPTASRSTSTSPELNPSLVNSRLTGLLEEVSLLNREWAQRRKEALRIYGVFRRRCQDLEGRLAEREGEVEELYVASPGPVPCLLG